MIPIQVTGGIANLMALVQPKALFLIGVYFGTGLAVASLVVMTVSSILTNMLSPSTPSVSEILAQLEEEKRKAEGQS